MMELEKLTIFSVLKNLSESYYLLLYVYFLLDATKNELNLTSFFIYSQVKN